MDVSAARADREIDAHARSTPWVAHLALFALSFALRWSFAGGDFQGDESWYFYLSRSFGLEAAAQVDHPLFHIANRPLYYLTFHASTYAGLLGFRLFAALVGAFVPSLALLTARALGASLPSAGLMALGLTMQRQHLEYAVHGFPDLLATVLALAACWAAARGRAWTTFALSTACVLCKESFVVVPALATFVRLHDDARRRPFDRAAWLTLTLPAIYVIGVTAISTWIEKIPLQGWSATPFDLKHAHNMWIGPMLWPFVGLLLWLRRFRALAIWLALPLFYLAWSRGLGRGLAPWYSIGPSALSAVALALVLDALRNELKRRHASPRVAALGVFVVLLCVASVPVMGALRVRAQLRSLSEFPRPRVAESVMALLAQRRPQSVLLVNCFWSFGYSHLRAVDAPASRLYAGKAAEVYPAAHAADLTIVCRDPNNAAMEHELGARDLVTVLSDRQWLVLTPQR